MQVSIRFHGVGCSSPRCYSRKFSREEFGRSGDDALRTSESSILTTQKKDEPVFEISIPSCNNYRVSGGRCSIESYSTWSASLALPLSVHSFNVTATRSSPLRSRRRIVPFSQKRQIARLALLLPNHPHRPSGGWERGQWSANEKDRNLWAKFLFSGHLTG